MAKRTQKEILQIVSEEKQFLLGINFFLVQDSNRLLYETRRTSKCIIALGLIALVGTGLILNSKNHSPFVTSGFDFEGLKTYIGEIVATLVVRFIAISLYNFKINNLRRDQATIIKIATKKGDVTQEDNLVVSEILRNNQLVHILPRLNWDNYL